MEGGKWKQYSIKDSKFSKSIYCWSVHKLKEKFRFKNFKIGVEGWSISSWTHKIKKHESFFFFF